MSPGSESDAPDDPGEVRALRSGWSPHPAQRAIMDDSRRFRVVACGRRWGKSEMCAHLAFQRAIEDPGAVVWWVAPTFDMANDYGFDKIAPLLSPEFLDGPPKRTKPRKIRFANGSELSFRSAEREDSLRGGGVDLLVIDESGAIPERAWTDELRPALSDTLGDMIAIGTPKGRNWFWRWFQRGQTPGEHADVASWRAPTAQNPHVPDGEIDSARGDLPERVFQQEYLAEFLDDAGGVFENVREHVEEYDLPVSFSASAGSPFGIGVDFARHEDWTVIVAIDAAGRVVAFERFQGTSWTRVQSAVERVAAQYAPNVVALDATRDNKVVSDLEDAGVNVSAVTFSAKRKKTLIENLITELESGGLTLPASESELLAELEAFEYDMTETGNVRYAAPSGMHDDCVDALALAADARSHDTGPTLETRSGMSPSTGARVGSPATDSRRSPDSPSRSRSGPSSSVTRRTR
jgi:hypothetical protein